MDEQELELYNNCEKILSNDETYLKSLDVNAMISSLERIIVEHDNDRISYSDLLYNKLKDTLKFLNEIKDFNKEIISGNTNGMKRYKVEISYYRSYSRYQNNQTWFVSAKNEKEASKIILDKYWDCRRKHIDNIYEVTAEQEKQFFDEIKMRQQEEQDRKEAFKARMQSCLTIFLLITICLVLYFCSFIKY